MKERERVMISALVMLMLILWLGFAVHRSPGFAGSLWGGVLGVSGAALMLVPLAYLIIKRVARLRRAVTRVVSMRTLLTWHIYAGVLGPVLVVLHTGHKFASPLGITLTAMTLVVVLSGFVGRYLLSYIAQELREKRALLAGLQTEYDNVSRALQQAPNALPPAGVWSALRMRLADWAFAGHSPDGAPVAGFRALQLAEAIADVEYAIRSHETFKRAFGVWLKCHIVISIALYVLLGLHVWSAIYFGLRWFA